MKRKLYAITFNIDGKQETWKQFHASPQSVTEYHTKDHPTGEGAMSIRKEFPSAKSIQITSITDITEV